MNIEELKAYIQPSISDEDTPAQDVRRQGGPREPGSGPRQAAAEPTAFTDRLAEIEVAAQLGYLLCQCTWPPQIMVLADDGFMFCCPRCHRRRDY